MKLHPDSRLLFIGDSITACGRKFPMGVGAFNQALGDGYVNLIDAALTAAYPDYGITTINMGISGNTVRDLNARWETDVLDIKPDWLVIKIGINDVWGYFSQTPPPVYHISVDEYAQTLDQLIQQTRSSLRGLILMTPYYLEPNRQELMRARMDQFGAVVRDMASRHQALLVDTQAAFDSVLPCIHPLSLAIDRIHPNLTGHMILARAFLQRINYSWE